MSLNRDRCEEALEDEHLLISKTEPTASVPEIWDKVYVGDR